jgi:hypothetical protein
LNQLQVLRNTLSTYQTLQVLKNKSAKIFKCAKIHNLETFSPNKNDLRLFFSIKTELDFLLNQYQKKPLKGYRVEKFLPFLINRNVKKYYRVHYSDEF